MEPNGLAAGSSDSTGDQSEALNQNRAHREHSGVPRCPADDPVPILRCTTGDWALALRARSGTNVRSAPAELTRDGCGSRKAKGWRRGRDSNP